MSKQLIIKNLVLEVKDPEQKDLYEKAVQRAFESIDTETNSVNLVKVILPDIPADRVQTVLQHINKDLAKHGITNCVFVPIHPQGIQDITIEHLEWAHEE